MSAHYTTDGVAITPGLRVFTYDCQWATVLPTNWGDGRYTQDANNPDFDGWFVMSKGGILNGERMSTTDLNGKGENQ